MDKNQLCNEVGANLVTNLNSCKAASEKIKQYMPEINFYSEDSSSSYPIGCYLYVETKVYFNPHGEGSKADSARPICRKSHGKFEQR